LIDPKNAALSGAAFPSGRLPRSARGLSLFCSVLALAGSLAAAKTSTFPGAKASPHAKTSSHPPKRLESHPAPARPFQDMPKTPVELIGKAIECINRGDTAGLYGLSVLREEYLQLYPYLPHADTSNQDDRNFRMGYFLMDNRKMAIRMFESFGKSNLRFSRMAFLGEKEDRQRFEFHYGLHVWVIKDGNETELPLSKTLVSVDGGWKLWGFSDS
jgi:hypothetical protein